MNLKLDSNVAKVKFNGSEVDKVKYNGNVVWSKPATQHIYGVSWNKTSGSPIMTRTDDAENFSSPVPYVNDGVMTAADCSSPFDNIMPWSGMVKSTDNLGNELVAIPKFWYKMEYGGTSSRIFSLQISNTPVAGFSVSPAHRARNAQDSEKNVVYIGRYHCDKKYKSKSGVIPKTSITRANARTGVHALGNDYWQLDMSMLVTIWMLYLVEFANWDSQEMIGYGCGNGSSAENTGSTDTMPYHTGTMQTSKSTYGVGIQYRYIENLWANVETWTDGIVFDGSSVYTWNNFSSYSDAYNNNTSDRVSTRSRPTTSNYIRYFDLTTTTGYEWFPAPNGNSTQTSVCDYYTYGNNPTATFGGNYHSKSKNYGLFYLYWGRTSYLTSNEIGARLQLVPTS